MEHGLKDIAFYAQKAYNTLHSCHNFPAGSRQRCVVRGIALYSASIGEPTRNWLAWQARGSLFEPLIASSRSLSFTLGGLRDRARHPRQCFGWPRRAKRDRPITHEWIDPWTLLLPGQHRWAQVGATGEPREFRLARSRQDKRLERAIPLTTHLCSRQAARGARICETSLLYEQRGI